MSQIVAEAFTDQADKDCPVGLAQSSAVHQEQYDENMADFFHVFNMVTGRPELYFGYIAGCLGKPNRINDQETISADKASKKSEKIAVDLGCGTGWLTRKLPTLGFTRVYGIDTSAPMLMSAIQKTSMELMRKSAVLYHNKVPNNIIGKCNLVTAVHVHYHFLPFEKLKTEFFGTISSLLEKNGEAILVGCPSDYVSRTPDHFQNSVHVNDIPTNVWQDASAPICLADKDGYIPLATLPPFKLKEGTQMKVTFRITDFTGKKREQTIIDTFWSDDALIEAAKSQGLELRGKRNLISDTFENAYMMMHFRKTNATSSSFIQHPAP